MKQKCSRSETIIIDTFQDKNYVDISTLTGEPLSYGNILLSLRFCEQENASPLWFGFRSEKWKRWKTEGAEQLLSKTCS